MHGSFAMAFCAGQASCWHGTVCYQNGIAHLCMLEHMTAGQLCQACLTQGVDGSVRGSHCLL